MNQKKMLILGGLLIGTLACAVPAMAAEGTSGDYMGGMGRQFVRGLGNVLSSPAEIPCTIGDEMEVRSSTGFFTGLGKGTAFMLRRILVGVCEVGTFMIPAEPVLPPVCKKA